jgi:hypothetical protein
MAQLGELSIEQLEGLQVTSVGKRPQPLSAAAASVFVITAEDIRRSGATSLPAPSGGGFAHGLELSVNGNNLLHPRHLEFNDPSSCPPRYIQRSVLVNLRAAL